MKNYNEMATDVFRRIGEYKIERKRRRKTAIRVGASLCCVCIATLLGLGVWRSVPLSQGYIENPNDTASEPVLDHTVSGTQAQIEQPTVGDANEEQEPQPEQYTGYIELSGESDYVAGDPKDIYRYVSHVLKVTYVKDLRAYVKGNAPLPVTQAECIVNQVIKGEYADEKIVIDYYGGTVPLSEWRKNYNAESQAKYGYAKYSEEEAKKIGVTCFQDEYSVELEPGKEYLVFVTYDERDQTYMVFADNHGVLPIEGGRVPNRMTGEMLKIQDVAQ